MKKRILCLFMVFVLCFSAGTSAYAASTAAEQTEGFQTEETVLTEGLETETMMESETVVPDTEKMKQLGDESKSEEAKESAQGKLSIHIPGSYDVLTVVEGTDLEKCNVTVSDNEPHYTLLSNSMVSGFDSHKLGYQEVTVTWNGLSNILKIYVIAEGEMIKPSKIEVNMGYGNAIPMGFSHVGMFFGVIYYDEYNNRIDIGKKVEVEISDFDVNKKGEHKVTVTSCGLTQEVTVRVVPAKVVLVPYKPESESEPDVFNIPINGNTIYSAEELLVNADNPSEMILGLGMGPFSLLKYIPELDISKPSFKTYSKPYEIQGLGYKTTAEFKIRVGTPEETDQVEDFVERLYRNILQREADPSGLKAWTDVLKSGKEQGAKVAQGFIESPEFQKRKLTDTQYLEILYQTFFERKADKAGLDAWLGVLDSGLSRMHVFKGFAESNEFTEICKEYGIIRGNVTLTAPMDQNEGVTKFIVRCYRLCLGRDADKDGLNSWCTQILTGKNTAKEAAHGFVFSDEFKKKKLSDKEYVKTMYRVFMDREADPAGLDAWVKVLKSGKSRDHVFNGFADSSEFKEICAEYGIR